MALEILLVGHKNHGKKTHKERDENGRIHQHQSQNGSPAVAEAVGDGSSHEHTEESTTLSGLEQRRLPLGLDGPLPVVEYTVVLLESGLRDEVSVEEHVERFHDLDTISTALQHRIAIQLMDGENLQ